MTKTNKRFICVVTNKSINQDKSRVFKVKKIVFIESKDICEVKEAVVNESELKEIINNPSLVVLNSYLRNNSQVMVRRIQITGQYIGRVIRKIKDMMLHNYGDNLEGHYTEAYRIIEATLKVIGYTKVKVINGWIAYSSTDGSTKCVENTWIELDNTYYIDIMADRLNNESIKKYPNIFIHRGLPHEVSYNKPI